MKMIRLLLLCCLLLAGCSTARAPKQPSSQPNPLATAQTIATLAANDLVGKGKIPAFDHVIVIVLENRGYSSVIGSSDMPEINTLAKQNVLLTNYYAVSHPSLPNYLALIGGDTFNINQDCTKCFVNQPSLPDLIEQSGRTWKTYQESMPAACKLGNAGKYVQKHNPFVYFDPIRDNQSRCQNNVVPLTQLASDLKSGQLPNFAFIMPNICNSGHDCGPQVADTWVKNMVNQLQDSDTLSSNSLIFITFDEGPSSDSTPCCGFKQTGGHVASVLISPSAKAGFQDATPYDHYSFLKTVLRAWGLPDLGQTKDPGVETFQAMWR